VSRALLEIFTLTHDRTLSILGIRAAKNKALLTRGERPQKPLNERRCSTLFLIFSGLSGSRSESALQNQDEGRRADQQSLVRVRGYSGRRDGTLCSEFDLQTLTRCDASLRFVKQSRDPYTPPLPSPRIPGRRRRYARCTLTFHIRLALLQALGDQAEVKQVKVYCDRCAPICSLHSRISRPLRPRSSSQGICGHDGMR
jgi:hypothetical protein